MTKKKRKKEKTSAQANNKNHSRGFGTRRVEKEFTGFTYHKMSSPFEGMAEDEVVEVIKNLGKNFGQQFDTSLETLQQQIFQVEPCSLLSLFAYYGLTTSPGINREWTEKNPILSFNIM